MHSISAWSSSGRLTHAHRSGCGQVGEVGRYRVEDRGAAVEVDVARLGPTGPELGVGIASGDQLAGVVETVEGVVADRLQQPVPRFPRRIDAVQRDQRLVGQVIDEIEDVVPVNVTERQRQPPRRRRQ